MFQNRVAFITGVAHGIGRAAALELADNRVDLFLADINKDGLEQTASLAREKGVRVECAVLDVSDEQAVYKAVADAEAAFGKIDILINNAGIYNTYHLFEDSDSAEWKKKIDINILGTMYPTKAVIAGMRARSYGRIINIASVAGVYGIVNMVDYSMSKGAIIGFTKALAKELATAGITVNAVSPGSIEVSGGGNTMPEHSFMGRAGTPEECAHMIVFLASDEASYVSGQNVQVDGCRKKM